MRANAASLARRTPLAAPLAPATLGAVLAIAGAVLPVAALWVVGVLLLAAALAMALHRRVPTWAASLVALAAAGLAIGAPLLALPRTSGLAGDWATPAIEGEVLAGRAVVSNSNASIDLRTGKTVRLGSVTGGSRWVADDRLLVVRDDRVDSVRLDASARWTWRPAAPSSVAPLAADDGRTVLRVCPLPGAGGPCRLVGLDARGRQGWTTDAPGQSSTTPPNPGPSGSLPSMAALRAPGGDGFFLVDPGTGRRTLVPGAAALSVPDGPVALTHESGGRCVTSLYAGSSPQWTKVTSAPCDQPEPSAWFVALDHLWVDRAGSWERFALATGARAEVDVESVPEPEAHSRVAATQEQSSLGLNPFRSADAVSVMHLRDTASGEELARLVTDQPARLLLADDGAVAVREGGRVIRYVVQGS
jgi:hypothetical protein